MNFHFPKNSEDYPPAQNYCAFSEDRRHRYVLWRVWDPHLPYLALIGLNPSTADEERLDPTVRRCVGYAKLWGRGGLCMLNLFSLRSTDPKALYTTADPEGDPDNMNMIVRCCYSPVVICAWGNHGVLHNRGSCVVTHLRACQASLFHLGLTKTGEPKHPLYLRKDTKPEAWRGYEEG